MRKLYLVPIIHTSQDMGSLATALNAKARAEVGDIPWQTHQETISGFWDSIAKFFQSINIAGLKVYQDGLVAGGDAGLRIVREGIRQGSKNYKIIGNLVDRGATLMKTEDLSLVTREYDYVTQLARSKSPREKEKAAFEYKLVQGKLLKQRDDFIAGTISETLNAGEIGVLFIGGYHDIVSRLPDDIEVVSVKESSKVKEYQMALATARRGDQHLCQLAEYLVSPIDKLT